MSIKKDKITKILKQGLVLGSMFIALVLVLMLMPELSEKFYTSSD